MKTRTQTSPRQRGDRASLGQMPRDVVSELRKVTWPTRDEAVRLTGMVLVVSAVVGLFLGAVDFIFTRLVTELLIGL